MRTAAERRVLRPGFWLSEATAVLAIGNFGAWRCWRCRTPAVTAGATASPTPSFVHGLDRQDTFEVIVIVLVWLVLVVAASQMAHIFRHTSIPT